MEICSVIKQLRQELGLSQMAFAEKMHVHFSTVNRWEKGHAKPNRLATVTMIELCHISVKEVEKLKDGDASGRVQR